MWKMASPPPSAEKEEWNELTAPVEVPVVEAANRADAASPKRVSLPSMDAPASRSAVPGCADSRIEILVTITPQRTPIAARIAYPCLWSLTIFPKVYVRDTGI